MAADLGTLTAKWRFVGIAIFEAHFWVKFLTIYFR